MTEKIKTPIKDVEATRETSTTASEDSTLATPIEGDKATDNIVTSPTSEDVLCGRGGATNAHTGNKRYRELVQQHQEQYLCAKKRDKSIIAKKIVESVRSVGGRFLKKVHEERNEWVEVADKKAAEKTSQALREGLEVRKVLRSRMNDECTKGSNGKVNVGDLTKKRRRTDDDQGQTRVHAD